MNETAIRHEFEMLKNKLREITMFDMWHLWTFEDEQRLSELKEELENMF